MKFLKRDLVQQSSVGLEFSEEIAFDLSQFQNNHSSLRSLNDVHVDGTLHYDVDNELAVADYMVSGEMVVACSITNDDVVVPFEGHNEETYSFGPSDDPEVKVVKKDVIDLSESVFQTILFEVPLRVVKEGLTEYPKGDGWEVLSEADYQASEKLIDPRLAKLLEFKSEE